MAGWTADETKALLGIWGAADVQSKLDGVVRNKTIYGKVASELRSLGYERTWEQCRTKIKNLVKKYRKVEDSNNVYGSGRITCHFYEELDAILGTRAASSPHVVLDSGGGGEVSVSIVHVSEEGEELALHPDTDEPNCHDASASTDTDNTDVTSHTPSTSSGADSASPEGNTKSAPLTPDMSSGTSDSAGQGFKKRETREAITARKRGQKRKGTILVEELCTALDKAEERAAEREFTFVANFQRVTPNLASTLMG